MPTFIVSRELRGKSRLASFTIVELLTVIFIIALLAALTLAAATGVMKHASRSRATSEVQAMATALDSYKTDNGSYPLSEGLLLITNTYINADPTAYQTNSHILYIALSGQTNFTGQAYAKTYMSFRQNQVGDPDGTVTGGTYVQDPWGNSYGYSTGNLPGAANTNYPYNGANSYDLWSTGGQPVKTPAVPIANTNAIISNWQ